MAKGRLLEDVGPEVATGHGQINGLLDGRPPLGVDVSPLLQPIGDQLLAGGTLTAVGAHSLSEGGLSAAGHLDGLLQRDDVGLIDSGYVLHAAGAYTNQFVSVNKLDCVTQHKRICNVVDLQTVRESRMMSRARNLEVVRTPKPRKKRRAIPGVDGKTLGQRIKEAMDYRSGQLRREYLLVELAREVNELLNAPAGKPILSQQNLSAIIRTSTDSYFTPFIARVCGVDSVWLAGGIGSKVPRSPEAT